MADNLGSILVRSVQFGERGPVFRRGPRDADTIVVSNGSLAGAGHTIEDEGTPLPDQDILNFVGGGVTVTDAGGKTVVTIPVGGVSDHGALTGLGDDDHIQYVLRQPTGDTVINESGGDFDWRMETTSEANAVVLDAGDDELNIRVDTNWPAGSLVISNGRIRTTVSSGATIPPYTGTNTIDGPAIEIMRLRSTRATRAVNDSIYVIFDQPTANGTVEEYARLTSIALSVTDAAETGALDITLPHNGVAQRIVRYQGQTSPGIVYNPDQLDINFVIASPNNANAFEMDAGRETVGIGSGALTNVQLAVTNPLLDAVSIEMLRIRSQRATRADNDEIYISLRQPSDTGAEVETSRISSILTDATNASIRSQFEIECLQTGTLRTMLLTGFDATGVGTFEVNPGNVDVDVIFITTCGATLTVNNGGDSLDGHADLQLNWPGFADFTNRVNITDAQAGLPVLLVTNNADVGNVEVLRLQGDRATPADGDRSRVDWYMQDSGFNPHLFGRITCFADDVSDGTEDGRIQFTVSCGASGGGPVNMLDLDSEAEAVIVNPDGVAPVDFKVLASGSADLFVVDVGASQIGLFGATPVGQSSGYTRNATIVVDRTLLASASATIINNNNVLAALIADLQAIGILG